MKARGVFERKYTFSKIGSKPRRMSSKKFIAGEDFTSVGKPTVVNNGSERVDDKDMDRIDRLILKAKPKPSLNDKLEKDNPYIGMNSNDLLDYMSGDNYRAPEMGTIEWTKFIYALMHSPSVGGLDE